MILKNEIKVIQANLDIACDARKEIRAGCKYIWCYPNVKHQMFSNAPQKYEKIIYQPRFETEKQYPLVFSIWGWDSHIINMSVAKKPCLSFQ